MAGYNSNINKQSNKNPRQKIQELKDPTYGIFMGEVTSSKDVSRTGRLEVFVPALAQDKNTKSGYFEAVWTSPFAGSTNPKAIGKEIENPEQSMQSYGLWMVPPDIGNFVLIAFGDGNMKYPVVVSCLYQDKFNHMVPGLPASKTYQSTAAQLPSVEKNKRSSQQVNNDAVRPIQHTLSEAIVKQGLMYDTVRGPSTSGARRESPSEVFGILTPGPRDANNFNYRLGGHQFIMDDNITSRNIRIRTAQGNQILLDDNEGMIYFINKSGKVWMEFSQSGAMHLYAENSINLRTRGDFNLRADRNVNIEAGQDVNIKAAGDTNNSGYAGAGSLGQKPTGTGGNLSFESQAETRIIASASILGTSAAGDIHLNSAGVFNATSGGTTNLSAGGNFEAESGGVTGIKAGADVRIGAGSNIVEKSGNNILMNSGGSSPSGAEKAQTIVSIATTPFEDQPDTEIEYNKDQSNPLPNAGRRTGAKPQVSSIVKEYVTAEPWIGHGVSDPSNQDAPGTQSSSSSAVDNIPQAGSGLTDPNGTPFPAASNEPSGYKEPTWTGAAKDWYNSAKKQYNNITTARSNFDNSINKELRNTLSSANIVKSLTASLPSVRVPTLDFNSMKILGSLSRLSDAESKLNSIAVDALGRKTDINSPQAQAMRKTVIDANNRSTTPEELDRVLTENGITSSKEGNVTVYRDRSGTVLRDFTNTSISEETNYALVQAEFLAMSDKVKPLISVQVSDHQLAAMTSMAMHIGINNLSRSKALQELNNGNYSEVPRAMLEFSVDSKGNRREDYYQRRIFEGELFQTPDYVPTPDYGFSTVSWQQQAKDLRNMRQQVLGSGS